ncbi:MAG: hypothetical protein ACLFRT_11370 [Actinomycetota bacterium]
MRTLRKTAVLVTAVALAMSLALPAMAQGPKHGSCERFGQAFAVWARGELVELGFGTPGTVMPVLAQTAPGHAAEILHAEMTMELEDIPGTPFCDPHPVH